MLLLLIYGPPGVGKLTVAKEISRITGFRLFHNHLTVEPVKAILEFGHPEFSQLLAKIRLSLLEAAAKNGVSCIFTGVYAAEIDDTKTRQMFRVVERWGGKVCLVKLTCERKELYRRVTHPSRAKFSKIRNVAKLKKIMDKHKLDTIMKFKDTLVIDNTKLNPHKAAAEIIKHYRLTRVK